MDGWMHGWMDGRTDGWIGLYVLFNCIFVISYQDDGREQMKALCNETLFRF